VTDRLRALSAAQLETALRHLGTEVDFPDALGLGAAVALRLQAVEVRPIPGPVRRGRRWRIVAIAVAAVLLLAATALAVNLIRIGSLTVEVIPPPSTTPSEVLSGQEFGKPVSVARAERVLGAPLAVPARLGAPDRVWIDRHLIDRVVLAWAPREGLPRIPELSWGSVIIRFPSVPGEPDLALASKEVGSPEDLVRTDVGGQPALWLPGEHVLTVAGEEPIRVTGTVLLWESEDATYRLETSLDLEGAIALAESLETAAG